MSAGPSVNFLCGRGYAVNFLCIYTTSVNFHQLSVRPLDLPLTFLMAVEPSVTFPWVRGTIYQLPSTFRAPKGSSANKLRPQNLQSTLVDFPCICRIYRKQASTFCEAGEPPVNFPSYRLTFRQLSLRPRDLSNSFHFPLLLSNSSSSRVSYPELIKYSPMNLSISITQ